MKPGTGDDPFADDPVDDPPDDPAETGTDDGGTAQSGAASPPVETSRTTGDARRAGEDDTDTDRSSDSEDDDTPEIPWVLRRSGVKDDRPNMTQFFLRDETDRVEREFRSAVERHLDKDVYLLDLREAAYLVAMEHPAEVAAVLEEWGYDYL